MENYMTITQAAEKWGLSARRVQKMCQDGLIENVTKFGRLWAIPIDAKRPVDGRVTTGKYKNWRKKDISNKGEL